MSILVNAYCTLLSPPELEFEHGPVSHRDRNDPELVKHLNDFVGYVVNKGGEMTCTLYNVMRHIERVQHQFSISLPESALEDFSHWAWSANALCFMPDGTVRDPSGSVLVDPQGAEPDPDGEVPFPDDAIERKATSLELLEEHGIRVPDSLPPVISEYELVTRDAAEVAKRMLALFLVAVRGESLASGEEVTVDDLRETSPIGFKALSPKEREFLDTAEPDESSIVQFTWRYEAICVLEWALGLIDDLPFPDSICDVQEVAQLALDKNTKQFVNKCELRPVEELLDALDLHYRLHWAARECNRTGKAAPAELELGVIMERHYALNWLVRFEDKDWDDVDTPT